VQHLPGVPGVAYTDPFDLEWEFDRDAHSCSTFSSRTYLMIYPMAMLSFHMAHLDLERPVLPFLGLARLLFADIAPGLVANLEETCLLCIYITNWTNANEIKVGISK
jgi:hypothetical protein